MEGFNDKLLKKGETVAVALSGGEDSVCLLFLLKNLEQEKGIKVVAINVEHGIRGEASLRDTAFCEDLCRKLSVPFKTFSVDAPTLSFVEKLSMEEAARKLRYDCFLKAVSDGFCDKVACAHHLDDNVETVLFNLFRGATVSGLRGMEETSCDGVIIRPLLRVKKADIRKYLETVGADFIKDETNDDVKYTRNFIRKEVVPLILSRFPSLKEAVLRLSLSAKSDDAYLYSLAKNILEVKDGKAYIPVAAEYPVFSRAAILALKALGVQKDFDNGHIAALFELCGNQSGKKVDLLRGLYGVREGDFIVVKKKTEKVEFCRKFTGENIETSDGIIYIEKTDGYKKDGGLYADLDKIPDGAVVRRRKIGDVFYKFGGGKVSLKKFLTDKKIPADEKDELYLIAKDDVVYVIAGVEISSLCKIDNQTVNAVKITIKNC